LVQNKITIECHKKIAFVAHGNKIPDLVAWAKCNRDLLAHHTLYATGTTCALLEEELGFPIYKLENGSRGRDQQIGAKIVDGEIDLLIFFWDPIRSTFHDSDVNSLLRTAAIVNIPVACNRATADFMITSPLMDEEYDRLLPEHSEYKNRAPTEIAAK